MNGPTFVTAFSDQIINYLELLFITVRAALICFSIIVIFRYSIKKYKKKFFKNLLMFPLSLLKMLSLLEILSLAFLINTEMRIDEVGAIKKRLHLPYKINKIRFFL